MTAFDTRFAARAGRRLLGDPTDSEDLGRFGEWIIYKPLHGKPRRIRAIVDRTPRSFQIGDSIISLRGSFEVYPSADYGIANREVDEGGDKVEFDLERNGKNQTVGIISQPAPSDNGLLQLGYM